MVAILGLINCDSFNVLNKIIRGLDGNCATTYRILVVENASQKNFNNYAPIVSSNVHLEITSNSKENFIAAGRLDNADQLCDQLNIPLFERALLSDEEVMRCAYLRWGRECSLRIYGDWAFAAWDPVERQLTISRSHYGNLPIYFFKCDNGLVFSTARKPLLKSGLFPLMLDELWLAQYLISWPAYQGERTPHLPLKCLPPGHFLVATHSGYSIHCYWTPIELPEIQFSNRDDYVESFRTIFDEAVRCRLRGGAVASTLSGGLDSGAVTATAARLLSADGQSLTAFTSVPLFDTSRYVSADRFGDELPLATATAQFVKGIDHRPVVSSDTNPVASIRQSLEYEAIPIHGAGNLFWIMDILVAAKSGGFNTLLTGQSGNAGISWTGDLFSQSWSFLLTHVDRQRLARELINRSKQFIKSALPVSQIHRRMEQRQWHLETAIHPELARRVHLLEQYLLDPAGCYTRNPREQRSRILFLGRSVIGTIISEIGLHLNLMVCDPTADARVLEFVLAVPDNVFMDPWTGIDRWLIRAAMKDRLPDKVRLNRSRGRQSGDMVMRLRAYHDDVENVLTELTRGPAAGYVDVEHMRVIWRMVQAEDTPLANSASKQILLRGIMAGLFVNGYCE